MKYTRWDNTFKSIEYFLCAFLILIIIILSLPPIHFDIAVAKGALCEAVPNIPSSNKSAMIEIMKNVIDNSAKKYFSKTSFLQSAFPYIESKKIPEIRVEDNSKLEEKKDVLQKNITESKNVSKNLEIKNETAYSVDVQSILSEKPTIVGQNGEPLVLVVHTHTSEAYESNGEYATSDTDRTQDANYNVVKVGDRLCEMLENKGISVIHDKTVHDYPSYTNSYKKSLETVERNLREHPSIKIVFDIHRDALGSAENKVKLTADINGEKAAQIMLVCGTNSLGLWFDNWEDNLRFAMQIQDRLERCYPGLARPLNLRRERFNLHATRASVLIEIGTNGNTLQEALCGAKYLGDTVADVINDLTILQ